MPVEGNTSDGFTAPFLVGCHWAAMSGLTVARSLNPGRSSWLPQYGQPLPAALLDITACHSWPLSQTHHAFFPLPAVKSRGLEPPFLVGCHWTARLGLVVARSVSPAMGLFPAQYGQPFPRFLSLSPAS